jgi:hypothetical protein
VWAALSDRARLAEWLGELDGDLRVGEDVRSRFFATGWEGTIHVAACEQAARLLLLTKSSGEPDCVIEVTLTDVGEETALVFEDRGLPRQQIAAYVLSGNPDYIGIGTDAVWVKADNGLVYRIDPRTGREVAHLLVSDELCQGLGVLGEEVWTCRGDDIVRINTRTNQRGPQVKVSKVDDQTNIGIGFGHVWVIAQPGNRLLGLNSVTNASSRLLGRCRRSRAA